MSTINFNNVDDMLRRINEELTARGLTNCHAKSVSDDEVVIQYHTKWGTPSMINVEWIEAQNNRDDKRVSLLDEIDDVLCVALSALRLQPRHKEYKVDHEKGIYSMPVEPIPVREPKIVEKTALQTRFEQECEAEFPKYFDFRLWPDGKYADELTRHTFAGYELAHKNLA